MILSFLQTFIIPTALASFVFIDVTAQTNFTQAIQYVKEQGIVEGYADGTYKPENSINRAEFTKILLGASVHASSVSGSSCFPDVQDQWFARYVCTAKEHSIIAGYPDGTFHPEESINTAEAAKIIVNTFNVPVPPGLPEDPWYTSYIAALGNIEALPSATNNPNHLLTRGEMAEMIYKVHIANANNASSMSASSDYSTTAAATTKLPFVFSMQNNWFDSWSLQTVGIPDAYSNEGESDDKKTAAWYETVDTKNIEVKMDDAVHSSYLRVHLPKGGYNPIDAIQGDKPLGGANLFATANIHPVQSLYLQYYIRLPQNFDFSRSGYLPGLGGGIIKSEYGVFGSSDFSQSIQWEKDGRLKMYASDRDGYVISSDPIPADNEWHKVDMYIQLNTVKPPRMNGTITLRIDDTLYLQTDSASIRSGADVQIEGVAFNVIYGVAGSYATPKTDLYIDIADMRIDTSPL